MSIIELETPWCFNAMSLEQHEVEKLQKYFVNEGNHQCDWQNSDYCGITSDGLSDYFCSSEHFDENEDSDNVTVYTIEQLRTIVTEHLAKQPVEKLEDGVVYYVTEDNCYHYLVKYNYDDYVILTERINSKYFTWGECKQTYTKATSAQIAHYEACVKAGKYVEPETVTEFVVGKWYKWFQKNHGNTHMGKFVSLDDDDTFTVSPWIWRCEKDSGSGTFNVKFAENITLIEDLSEIQEFLPDGHPDLIVKPKSERYLATIKFFEQLREPERSEAIANYDEEYSICIPKGLQQALSGGFCWDNTEQESDYWEHIHGKLLDNTYFKEELLVFGKYKVGDIVVSIERRFDFRQIGGMFKVLETSTKYALYYDKELRSEEPSSWRPATPEEVEAYNQGVRNIADIKPKDYKEVVHCTTQEEWNFVLSKFNPRNISNNYFRDGQHCINTISPNSQGCVGSLSYYKELNFTILTFKQWCDKYGHSYEVVPEYVECISSTESHYYKVGKVYTWPDTITEQGKHNKPNVLKGSIWEFKPSTKEAYDKQQEKLKMEELLSEAKLKFPIGTKFKCYVSRSAVHEVKDLSLFVINQGHVFYEHQMVYNGTSWTEIIKEEPWVAQVGDWVYTLPGSSGWGMSSGDEEKVFKVKEVSNNWFEETRIILDGSSNPTKISSTVDPVTLPTLIRKATQEEIDSVAKTAVINTQAELAMTTGYISHMQEASLQGVSNLEKATSHQKTLESLWTQVHSVFDKHNAKQDAKQDELVIYKPKRVIL